MESERESIWRVFDTGWEPCVIAQGCGIRVTSYMEQGQEQKSIKLFARDKYQGENQALNIPFFVNTLRMALFDN